MHSTAAPQRAGTEAGTHLAGSESSPVPSPARRRGQLLGMSGQYIYPRHIRLADNYLRCMDVGEAARRSGYTAKAARRILRRPEVQAELQARRERVERGIECSARRVLRELAAIAYLDPTEYLDDSGRITTEHLRRLDRDVRAAIADLEVRRDGTCRVRPADKLRALRMLAEHYELLGGQQQAPEQHLHVHYHQMDDQAKRKRLAELLALEEDETDEARPGASQR